MTPDPIKLAGDSALLLELGPATIDPALNARAIAVARAIWRRGLPGVRDVVPTFRSVAVFFDPLSTDVPAVEAALREAADVPPVNESATTIDIPVVYGGAAGPDLASVADRAGCTPEAVVERHAGKSYRVYMLGFLPGFPYMAHVDPTIAAPRHATPRLRVAGGSVGIAGVQTGIYPRESPGGWQIIGRTPSAVFDAARTRPALLAPGDRVRFVATSEPAHAIASSAGPGQNQAGVPAQPRQTTATGRRVTVLRPGMLTTVQDRGRWGHQWLGVSVSGPMDPSAHRLANLIVGNPSDAATLEATIVGPELRIEQETRVVVTGGDLRATVDGADVTLCAAVRCRAGSVLGFGERRAGSRAYIAFDGGIATTPVLSSRATHPVSGLGGLSGRALEAGDQLPLNHGQTSNRAAAQIFPSLPAGGARLRVLPGPQADHFEPAALEALQRTRFTISLQSDRMGYRLLGGVIGNHVRREMISDVTFAGGVQIPPSGDPILLMADRQTTGGYPQLAIVITADLPLAGQLGPGDWIEFEVCTRSDALAALVGAEGKLLAVR